VVKNTNKVGPFVCITDEPDEWITRIFGFRVISAGKPIHFYGDSFVALLIFLENVLHFL
jgi:hypothetical protein